MSTAAMPSDEERLAPVARRATNRKSYRPDIDGLRAIAIVLVLLFHAGLGFPGGFVGVDVFFVISGFLITSVILKGLDSGEFSLNDFWVRRVKRIIPAAWVMVVTVLCAGLILLVPADYDALARSAVAQQLMLANVYFWKNTGYFAGAAELMPLLHTWSLAVEEQFYLGYPIVVMALYRYGRRPVAVVITLFTTASFAASVYGVSHHPSATFFFLPTRAWELCLGGLLCFMPTPTRVPRPISEMICWSSLATVIATGMIYTSTTPFPGLPALLPCGATALLIWMNSVSSSSAKRLLSATPLVFVGLISYSLYLWHWPLFAFSRYWHDGALPVASAVFLIAATAIVATASWRFVEMPFRTNRPRESRVMVFVTAGAATGCALLCARLIVQQQGLQWRADPAVSRFRMAASSVSYTHEISVDQAKRGQFPAFGDPDATRACILWGDSHAMALMSGLDAACKNCGFRAYQATHSSTPPVLDMVYESKYGLNHDAPAFNAATLQFIRDKRISVVFLSGRWANYVSLEGFAPHLRRTIQELNAAGACVAVVLDVADQRVDVPRHYAQRAFWSLPLAFRGIPHANHVEINRRAEDAIREACVAPNEAFVVDPAEGLVDASGIWRVERDGELLYRDAHHLSAEGSLALRGLFCRFLQAYSNRGP